MSATPQLTLLTGPEGCSLRGWEERVRWGILNDPLWHSVFRAAARSCIQESDALKLLAVQQADEIASLKKQLMHVHSWSTGVIPPFSHDPSVPFENFKIKVDAARPL